MLLLSKSPFLSFKPFIEEKCVINDWNYVVNFTEHHSNRYNYAFCYKKYKGHQSQNCGPLGPIDALIIITVN